MVRARVVARYRAPSAFRSARAVGDVWMTTTTTTTTVVLYDKITKNNKPDAFSGE